ncbi:hypothetical protein [Nonomuraea turcica]|uniref:hypothetical protein n=1 Tax=Nonomuraea sp. G32 TaxID=3067274 RepID=UPI0035302DDE
MREVALAHGEDEPAAALIPLAVDTRSWRRRCRCCGPSRHGARGGALPWGLLIISSLASIGANVAVAEPAGIALMPEKSRSQHPQGEQDPLGPA